MSARSHIPEAGDGRGALRILATAVLLGLLMVLGLRLTMTETLREPLARLMSDFAAKAAGKAPEVRIVGPEVTVWLAIATMALAAMAGVLGAVARSVSLGRVGKFVLAAVILGLAVVSTFHAANRFAALIGMADLAMALLGGWTIAVLCDSRMLGDRGRRIVIAALVAILATWAAKGLYQRFSELPDTLAYFQEHQAEQLEAHGVDPNDTYYAQLFVSRLKSMEVSGFLSFSNVMAAGLIGLVTVLAGLLAASFVTPAERAEATVAGLPPKKGKREAEPDQDEVPVKIILQVAGAVLVAMGMVVGVLTGSRGGSTLTIVCPLVFAAAVYFRGRVWAWRKAMIVAVVAATVLGAAGVVSYGVARDRLPSKSLTFRWHYWTGAAKLVRQAPGLGVGLNNFSEYYGSVKRASSPEDVADPHSFFVRIAAELGVPVTILIAILLAWMIATSLRFNEESLTSRAKCSPVWPRIFVVALILSLTWWLIHYFLAEPAADFYLYLAILSAVIGAGAATLVMGLAEEMPPRVLRRVSLAGLLGAVGMLAYDQINMAIVTGPVAMLFWVLLGLADSHEAPGEGRGVGGIVAAIVCGGGAVAMTALVAAPLSLDKMAWDPRPAEMRYIETAARSPQEALAAIDQAIALSPRTMELLRARLELKLRMRLPVAEDIRQMLTLDRANARIRISLASIESDLPAKDRIEILQEALRLDAELPVDEIKRLSPEKKAEVSALMEQLSRR